MAAIPLSCQVILNRSLQPTPLLSCSLPHSQKYTSIPLRTTPLPYIRCIASSTPQALLVNDYEEEIEEVVEDIDDVLNSNSENDNVKVKELNLKVLPSISLSIKEKKELASYAHSLGKDLRSQQIGKSGVTDTVITALIETLEKRELLKLKIHNNCPTELDDAINQIAGGTGSVVVSQIGRTVILYRPSVSKMKAEEKKRQVRRVFVKNPTTIQSKGQILREIGRGRRGSSRV